MQQQNHYFLGIISLHRFSYSSLLLPLHCASRHDRDLARLATCMPAVATEEKVAGDAAKKTLPIGFSMLGMPGHFGVISQLATSLAIRPSDGRRADKHPPAKGGPAAAWNWENHVWRGYMSQDGSPVV
ncbi:hypothetical protein TWF696_001153 [Orbilia brochopaga]|uniref:Uncharacterized protein n=1 Tax=Orbilia brochopaga TaxID=3140254 RepID=A0AAV9VG38_9PEZI